VKVDRVAANELQREVGMRERHMRDERIVLVVELARPLVVGDPAKVVFRPDAKTKRPAGRVILFADMRVVEIAQLVRAIEIQQQRAVAERKVTGHSSTSIGH